jgi:thioredoxin reductase (NADPH)
MTGKNEYDVVIAGGGIAGLTAALTLARVGRRTRVLTGPALGGHLLSIEKIDGFPGFPDGVPGYDLCPMVQEQAVSAGAEFAAAEAKSLARQDGFWRVDTSEGGLSARAVIVAAGTELKELGVPGEERLRGKGVSHCATCDGPLLRNRVVGVVGGGDSALQEALTLAQFASRVLILHRGSAFSAQRAYRERVEQTPKIEVRFNTSVEEVLGDAVLTGVRIRSAIDGTTSDVELASLFVYIGLKPNTDWLKGLLDLDSSGRIETDGALRCLPPGLFAVGTIRSGAIGRAAGAAGDGATAAIGADRYLTDGKWRE